MKITTEPKQQQLDWRRGKVLELSAQGYSEREIADTIQVSAPTVHRDLVHPREQAQANLQRHIHQTIPQEYQQSLTGINLALFVGSYSSNVGIRLPNLKYEDTTKKLGTAPVKWNMLA